MPPGSRSPASRPAILDPSGSLPTRSSLTRRCEPTPITGLHPSCVDIRLRYKVSRMPPAPRTGLTAVELSCGPRLAWSSRRLLARSDLDGEALVGGPLLERSVVDRNIVSTEHGQRERYQRGRDTAATIGDDRLRLWPDAREPERERVRFQQPV